MEVVLRRALDRPRGPGPFYLCCGRKRRNGIDLGKIPSVGCDKSRDGADYIVHERDRGLARCHAVLGSVDRTDYSGCERRTSIGLMAAGTRSPGAATPVNVCYDACAADLPSGGLAAFHPTTLPRSLMAA